MPEPEETDHDGSNDADEENSTLPTDDRDSVPKGFGIPKGADPIGAFGASASRHAVRDRADDAKEAQLDGLEPGRDQEKPLPAVPKATTPSPSTASKAV